MDSYMPTQNERQLLVARICGYLDAIASVNGQFREYVANATLLEIDADGIEKTVRSSLNSRSLGLNLIEFKKGKNWTEAEPFLQKILLSEPFGEKYIGHLPQLPERRFELAFQLTDLIMFLAKDQEPKGIFHLVMENDMAIYASGCAVEYENDILLIVHIHWRIEPNPAVEKDAPPKSVAPRLSP